MDNREIAKIFYKIGNFLEMEGVSFRPQAYQKAAFVLESMKESVADIYKQGGLNALEQIAGVGKNLAERIEEYLKTGHIRYYEKLKKETPIEVEELIAVEGLGLKKVKKLYQELGIRNLSDLEKAAKKHKIAGLAGFGETTEKNILEGIAFLKKSKGRFLLGEIFPKVEIIKKKLEKLEGVERVDVAGSVRRMKETIGDIDFLVISKKPKRVMSFFASQPEIKKIWGMGSTKLSVRTKEGFDVDIRVLPKKNYGAALQYFTGSKEHNIALRRIAIEKGMKLSEYALFKKGKIIVGSSEEGIYQALGMEIIPPELRENQGEVEASLKRSLPKIIKLTDIKGDLHVHSDWDGGENSIKEIALISRQLGYEYIGIADHTKFLRIENGLDEKQLTKRNREIEKLNQVQTGFRILKGAEVNILKNGSLDIKDEALKKLDFVIAGVHSNFKMAEKEMTERIIKAMKNPHIDIISHPTGRILKRRDEYEIDFDKILRAAKQFNVALEINSYPERLDLKDRNIRLAKEAGVKMIINTDAHHISQLEYIKYGIAQARRGWAERKDILNSLPVDKLLSFFK